MRYTGVLYAGLMVHEGHAKVLEFNVRFGDPEAQVLMMRLVSDLAVLMGAATDGTLSDVTVEWDPRAAACVVLAAEGYPGAVERGRPIDGLDGLRDWKTAWCSTPGRGGTGAASSPTAAACSASPRSVTRSRGAVASAYDAVSRIGWQGMQFRGDIGHRAMGGGGERRP